MNDFPKDQFKKLTNEEKDRAVADLVLHPEEIICKSINDLFIAKPLSFKKPNQLYFDFLQKDVPLLNGEEIICQFLYKKESMYIFKCEFMRDARQSAYLLLNSDFYIIQRRENYRLRFPSSFTSKVLIKEQNEVLIGRVFDLSTTGIRVSTTTKPVSLTVGNEVQLEIQAAGHEPLLITAVLRHRTDGTDVINNKKTNSYYFGFQFTNVSKENEKSLSRINMELYRNFLQKVMG